MFEHNDYATHPDMMKCVSNASAASGYAHAHILAVDGGRLAR